ncbi:MAG: Fic family protein [Candidatus Diapherotrites archaeon]|nr:Fic family protein [Candidatus Diapherotrites archaeon]
MASFRYLTREDILDIHDRIHVQSNGFMSSENLNFIIDQIKDFPELAGIEPRSPQEKVVYCASYLLFHLVKGHCFNDGNKRTAFISFNFFLHNNQFDPTYDEENIKSKLIQINQKINQGSKPFDAINEIFGKNSESPDFRLITLLFELAGANPKISYLSPLEIVQSVQTFIKWKKPSVMEDSTPMLFKKSRFKAIPVDHDELIKFVDEFIKKNPETMKLLEKS